jgi:hypothetical protein
MSPMSTVCNYSPRFIVRLGSLPTRKKLTLSTPRCTFGRGFATRVSFPASACPSHLGSNSDSIQQEPELISTRCPDFNSFIRVRIILLSLNVTISAVNVFMMYAPSFPHSSPRLNLYAVTVMCRVEWKPCSSLPAFQLAFAPFAGPAASYLKACRFIHSEH